MLDFLLFSVQLFLSGVFQLLLLWGPCLLYLVSWNSKLPLKNIKESVSVVLPWLSHLKMLILEQLCSAASARELLITPWQEGKTKGPPSFHSAVNHYQAWNLCNCWQVVNVVSFVFWNRRREWQQKEKQVSVCLSTGNFLFPFQQEIFLSDIFFASIFILLMYMYVYIFILEHTHRQTYR